MVQDWSNVVRIMTSPRVAFESMTNRWKWFPALVVMAGLQTVISLLLLDRRIYSLPTPAVALVVVSQALNPWATLLMQAAVLALILWIASMLQSDDTTFGQWFTVVMWSFVPVGTVGLVLRSVTRVLGHLQYVFFGPAVLLPPDAHGFTKVLFASCDLFSVGSVLLAYVGARVFTKNQSKWLPPIAAAVVYLLFLAYSYMAWK